MDDPTIGDLILENGAVAAECARLKAENERLREALETIARYPELPHVEQIAPDARNVRLTEIARKALERTNG